MSDIVKNTICYMCMNACPMKVHVSDGRVTEVELPEGSSPIPCVRWRAQMEFVYHPDRLLHPLKRVGDRFSGRFERVSWEEALDITASNLNRVKQKYGPESVVFWISYTKEPRPYFHRLTHAFGSPNYCTESSSCASAAFTALMLTYGMSRLPLRKGPPKCLLVWSSSIIVSQPKQWSLFSNAREKGIKVIVVDPRRTKLAEAADVHLQLRPGTDGALALSIMNVIVSENLHDKKFIGEWTSGFDEFYKLLKDYTPEKAEKITGVPAGKIREAAVYFATAKPARIITSANSTTHHSNGVQNHRAIALLPAVTGDIEVPVKPPPEAALQDITMHDRVKDMPPGIGSLRFPIWTKMYGEMQSNSIADQIDSGEPYPVKAMFSAGLNIQFFPNSNRMVESLKKLDFIAVADFQETPASKLADVILPISSWWERSILIGNAHGHGDRLKYIEPAIEPLGESWPEWKIYSELAKRLGFGEDFWNGDFEKCADYQLEPRGIKSGELKNHPEGIPMSVKTETSDLVRGFMTPSGKIEFASTVLAENNMEPLPVYKEPAESPVSRPDLAKSFPLVLTTGARTPVYTHSQFRNIDKLHRIMPDPLADINPVDAVSRGIKSGDAVLISSPRGSIRMKAMVTDTILPGVVSIPHHWKGEANANILTDDINLDPISGFPAFKSLLCQVKKA
jgi:anaerobic selenocysteine-containing dehydrogenase